MGYSEFLGRVVLDRMIWPITCRCPRCEVEWIQWAVREQYVDWRQTGGKTVDKLCNTCKEAPCPKN